MSDNQAEIEWDEGECCTCGTPILGVGTIYYDGQEVVCPMAGCRMIHQVCCDSETPIHLHSTGGKLDE